MFNSNTYVAYKFLSWNFIEINHLSLYVYIYAITFIYISHMQYWKYLILNRKERLKMNNLCLIHLVNLFVVIFFVLLPLKLTANRIIRYSPYNRLVLYIPAKFAFTSGVIYRQTWTLVSRFERRIQSIVSRLTSSHCISFIKIGILDDVSNANIKTATGLKNNAASKWREIFGRHLSKVFQNEIEYPILLWKWKAALF